MADGGRQPLKGQKIADRRVRVERPHAPYFRYTGEGSLVADKPAPITIVVLPEYVARHWWERILYNQQARRLKSVLVGREHTVIADVPYRREH